MASKAMPIAIIFIGPNDSLYRKIPNATGIITDIFVATVTTEIPLRCVANVVK